MPGWQGYPGWEQYRQPSWQQFPRQQAPQWWSPQTRLRPPVTPGETTPAAPVPPQGSYGYRGPSGIYQQRQVPRPGVGTPSAPAPQERTAPAPRRPYALGTQTRPAERPYPSTQREELPAPASPTPSEIAPPGPQPEAAVRPTAPPAPLTPKPPQPEPPPEGPAVAPAPPKPSAWQAPASESSPGLVGKLKGWATELKQAVSDLVGRESK